MKKIWFLWLLLVVFSLTACGKKPDLTAELVAYNDEIVALQVQGGDALENYYAALEEDFDGTNLREFFEQAQKDLIWLIGEAEAFPAFQKDNHLQYALVSYLSWLSVAFEYYETPVLNYFDHFTGQTYALAKEYEKVIAPFAIQLTQEIERLDNEFLKAQADFAARYHYPLSTLE